MKTFKTCTNCKRNLPLDNFYRAGKYYQSTCKECFTLKNNQWKKDNWVSHRWYVYKSRNKGTTVKKEEFVSLLLSASKCEICESTKNLSVDHDHETGKLRGILCADCNHAIGKLKDNTLLLTKAIGYLSKDR